MKRGFAPASIGNVAVGFDLLGLALPGVGDEVEAEASQTPGVRISGKGLPQEPEKNTAGQACLTLLERHAPGSGVDLTLHKGIPLSAGMGGSAASAVAAVVACDAELGLGLPKEELMGCALEGERVASGGYHGDNVAPSLFGGLTLVSSLNPLRVFNLPIPKGLEIVLVHPHLKVQTSEARELLKPQVDVGLAVEQSARLAGFMVGCYEENLSIVGDHLEDLMIEPQRKTLVAGFDEAKKAAMDAGALGFSLSGSGPSVFALVATGRGDGVCEAIAEVFDGQNLSTDRWVGPPETQGARIL